MFNDDCGCGQTRRGFIGSLAAIGVALPLAALGTTQAGGIFATCEQKYASDRQSCDSKYNHLTDMAKNAACVAGAWANYLVCKAASAAQNFKNGIQNAIDWIGRNGDKVAIGLVIGIVVVVGIGVIVSTGGAGAILFAPALL